MITSWSTQANANADKEVELKVFAPPHRDNIFYEVRGQEGPHILTAGALNTFPAQVKVEAGPSWASTTAPSGPLASSTACPAIRRPTYLQRFRTRRWAASTTPT